MSSLSDDIARLRLLTEDLSMVPFDMPKSAIFILDRGKFVDCNEEATLIFGCAKEDLVDNFPGKVSPEKQKNGKSSIKESARHIQEATKTGHTSFKWQHQRSDGELFDADVMLSTIMVGGSDYILATVTEGL